MSKLTLKDVKIIGEGPQIRKAILQRYKSVEEFYKEHSDVANKLPTLNNYLSRDVIISDSFKCRMTFILDVDYPSLFVTKTNQIKNHVNNIYYNISKYDQEEDQQVFDYLVEYCKEEKLETELAMMYRAKARTYYETNRISRFIEYYEFAIEVIPKSEFNKMVLFNCEFANDFLRENSIDKAEKIYRHLDKLLRIHEEKLEEDTLFFYHYRRGLAYMYRREHSAAKRFFTQAEEYSTNNRAKSSAIANVGLIYKKQRKYDEALKYYINALNYTDPVNLLTTASIYNNIAEAYKCKKDYLNGLEYIEKALEISERENDLGKHLVYIATKVDIKKRLGDKYAYREYFDVLLSTKNRHIRSKPYVLADIESFIENTNDIPCLKELANIIIELRNATSSEGYKRGLAERAGLIYIKIEELNKGV